MNATQHADAYLTIPDPFGGSLGGLVWALQGDAIERWNGTTLVFAEELREILEGVFAQPPIPPFGYVLALIRIMRDGPDSSSVALDRLWRSYTAARGVPSLLRNAGLLIATLCRELPALARPPAWSDVLVALKRRRLFHEHWRTAEEPLLSRAEFERRTELQLAHFDDESLEHWLNHGCNLTEAGEKLAEPLDSLPVRVSKLLTLARRMPRLAGAAALVATIDGALTIPPRRRSPDSLPQGGYCDVTTRGEPERLLPAQFALETDEFIRRFAERELLYFKREEPHASEKPERVIVLDQGVRTWGNVRLALAAAALVLLRKDAKRIGRVRLALTSSNDLVDVLEPSVEAIAEMLEASDLSPHCGPCLGSAIAATSAKDAPRDLIVLTHPRNLRELDVIRRVQDLRDGDRLFALSVDERGRAELHDWRESGLVPVRSFRVDLALAERLSAEPVTKQRIESPGWDWTGDIEPIPFPFRPGLVVEPVQMGFDDDGEWLVIVGREGILQGLTFDGSPPEVLPRAMIDGAVLKQIDAVKGVLGGVVVCGRMEPNPKNSHLCPTPPGVSTTIVTPGTPVLESSASWSVTPPAPLNAAPPKQLLVAVHYDRIARRITVHRLMKEWLSSGFEWLAYPEIRCIEVRVKLGPDPYNPSAVARTTLGETPAQSDAEKNDDSHRHAVKRHEIDTCGGLPKSLPVIKPHTDSAMFEPWMSNLFVDGNEIHPHTEPRWEPFTPLRDGKPLLESATILYAQVAGDVLVARLKRTGERSLVLFERTECGVLGELRQAHLNAPFALSRHGRSIAYIRPFRDVVVADTCDVGTERAVAKPAALHNGLTIKFEDSYFRLVIRIGGFEHAFTVRDGLLQHQSLGGNRADPPATKQPQGAVHHPPTEYDAGRFPPREIAHTWGWRAVPDRLGQVLLFTKDEQLVASFLVRRERVAAWCPGGVFWGDPLLIGGPATPDAGRKIAAAINQMGALR